MYMYIYRNTHVYEYAYTFEMYIHTHTYERILQLFEVIIGVIRCVLLDSLPRVASGSTRQCSHDWSRQ